MAKPKGCPQGRNPLDPARFFPLTFTDRLIRVRVLNGKEYRRFRHKAWRISQNVDPRTLGEVLLRGIKEGA
jgi:hypothetical protein